MSEMILSNTDIKKYIETGKIKIDPFDESMIYPASYAFRLGAQLLSPIGNDLIDFKKNLLPEYREINLTDDGYELKSGEFVLAQTKEIITLSPSVAMIIEGRSTLARVGIEVTQTSLFIEPDHNNSIITLELKNSGKSPVMIYPDMKFAKGIFVKLSSEFESSGMPANYKNQSEVTAPHVKNFF